MTSTSDRIRCEQGPLLEALREAGADVTRPNQHIRCPFHEDRNASGGVYHRDGVWRYKCHGCDARGDVFDIRARVSGRSLADELLAVRDTEPHHNGNGKARKQIIATYDYNNAEGELLYQVVRYEPKDFRQRVPDGTGWTWSMEGVERVLYHLWDLATMAQHDTDWPVYVVEGEKDADRLGTLTLLATSNVGGAGKWRDEYAETLRGRRCILLPDNDDAGRSHMQTVATSLYGVAASVKVLELPDLPPKGDVSDWLDAGGTAEQLTALAEAAAEWQPGRPNASENFTEASRPPVRQIVGDAECNAAGPERFRFYGAAEFDGLELRRDYHIPGILAAGPVPTILAGSFKTLKTSIAVDLLVSLASGTQLLGEFPVSSRCNVAVMSGESGGFALQNLLRRVAHGRGWTMDGIGNDHLRICTAVPDLTLKDDMAWIERFIEQNEIRLFMLDPTYLAMRGLRPDDAGSLFSMGRFLEPLAGIGERTGCTPLIVHHNSRGATRANVGEPAELADIAWSGFAEWAGQWLLLARREKYDPDSNGEHRLWLTAGGRDGHSTLVGVNVTEGRHDDPGGRVWRVSVEQASKARREASEAAQERKEQDRQARQGKQIQQHREVITNALKSIPGGDTKRAIRDNSGLYSSQFNSAFAALLADGVIIPCEVTKTNGQSYAGFKPK
jgi:hypothetical protein